MSEQRSSYRGALGAFPYAFRSSASWLFRSYVLVAGILSVFLLTFFLLALPGWIAGTMNQSATVTLSRAFLALVFFAVGAPLVAPVLLVARRHRRDQRVARRYDELLALAGYLFVGSVYLGLLITTPEAQQETPSGVAAPVVAFLYDLPRVAGAIPPLVSIVAIVLLHRRLRG